MGSRRPLLPDAAGVCGLVIFLVLTAFAGAKSLRDGDTLWHIKFGQIMLEQGEILTHDSFSHTAYGQPWHAHEWLSEIIMAACYNWAGLPGVAVFYFAIVALTLNLLFKIASRLAGDAAALAAVTISLSCSLIHLLARPHIFTWLGAALTLLLLEKGGRWPWLLIPLTALWANLHGGVLFGLAIQGIFITGSLLDQIQAHPPHLLRTWWNESRKFTLLLICCALAACVNPFGYHLFLFPFDVASPIFVKEINEWQSPDFQVFWYGRAWIVAVLFMAIMLGRKLSWKWYLLLLFLLWQTLGHVRHLSMGTLLLIPCFALLFKELFKYLPFRRKQDPRRVELAVSPWSGPVALVLLTIAMIVTYPFSSQNVREHVQQRFPLPEQYSTGLMEFLEKGFPQGNLLNEYEWGDYLLFGLDRPPKVFIDGRADMYGETIFSDYLKMARLEKEADSLLEKYQIDWVIFQKDHLLVRYLNGCKGWDQLYQDKMVTVLNRPSAGAVTPVVTKTSNATATD